MWESKLQETQIKVDNIVERRLQFNRGFRRITRTRVFYKNITQSSVFNYCLCNSTRSTATCNNNCRCLSISRTRISYCNTFKDRCRVKLCINWECNLWTQCVVMRVIITKVIVLKSLNLTNAITFSKDRSTSTKGRNNDFNVCTRTCCTNTKNAINCLNINGSSCISSTRRCNCYCLNLTRDCIALIILSISNCDLNKTTFTIACNRHTIICSYSIFCTRIINLNSFNISVRNNTSNNRKSRIETARVYNSNISNRTNCFLRTCSIGCCGGLTITFWFIDEQELKDICASCNCSTFNSSDIKDTLIRRFYNVEITTSNNRRISTSSRGIKVIRNISNDTLVYFQRNCRSSI